MNQQMEQNRPATENNAANTNQPAAQEQEVKKMNVNPNPRANENVTDADTGKTTGTSGVGSEITDGEAG